MVIHNISLPPGIFGGRFIEDLFLGRLDPDAHPYFRDVAALADGQWQWNGWLTPKGRVIALFALLRLDAQTLWICLPDADAAGLVDALRRYVFRSKLALALRDDLHACGSFTAPALARGERWARIGDAIELDMSADGGARTLRLQPARAGDDAAAVFRERGRVALGSGPRYGAEAGRGFVRLNFATSPQILEEAVRRMASAL